MAFSVTGTITISDVRDGQSAPTIILSNENHTFPADQTGSLGTSATAITSVLGSFTSSFQVFVGGQAYTSTTDTTPGGTNYYIRTNPTVVQQGNATPDLTVNINRTTGVITVADAGTADVAGFSDTGAGSLSITLQIDIAGFTSPFTRVITLAKSLGGSAPITRVASSTQTVEYNGEGALITGQDDIVIQSEYVDGTGSVMWSYRQGGTGTFTTIDPAALPTGLTLQTFDSVAQAQITLTTAGYNTLLTTSGDYVTFRATRGQASDQITISRLQFGRDAIYVVVEVTSGSQILRSDTQEAVVRADVYQNGAILQPENDWTYLWSKDGTELTAINQADQTGATQGNNEGFNQRSLRIQGDGITDNSSNRFSVTVAQP